MKYTKVFTLIFSIIGIGIFIILNLIQDKKQLNREENENEYTQL